MASTRASNDLTQGSVFRHIIRLVAPMSFGILAMMLVGVIDAYWVGRLGTDQQAAVQFVFPVSMLVMRTMPCLRKTRRVRPNTRCVSTRSQCKSGPYRYSYIILCVHCLLEMTG